jgi:hypothetical protein
MAGMGPAPKPEGSRQRRNAVVAMTRLPAEGRSKRAPNWPLIPDVVLTTRHELATAKVQALDAQRGELESSGKSTAGVDRKLDTAREHLAILAAQLRAQRRLEAQLWKDLWSTPQSVQWERLRYTREVARYVRHTVLAELGDIGAAKEARQWSDRLGLTPLALLRLRWAIAEDEVAARRTERAAATPTAQTREPAADPLAALHAV